MTKQDRQDLLEEITLMVLEDFGEADGDAPFNPFYPADVARQAVIMLQAAYEEFEDVDDIASSVFDSWLEGNAELDSDNLAIPN